MKKKSVLLAGVLCLAVIAGGCGKKTTQDFGYDVNSYVTIGDYEGIEYTLDSVEVTDEDIQARIQTDLDAKSTTEEIKDRAIQDGDTANIDFKGLKDGVAFEGGTGTQDLVIGSDTFIDGFEDQLIGAKTGEKKEIKVTFPEDYQAADLAGQPVVFEVTINSISLQSTPELTEDTVKEITDYDTIDAYKAALKEELTQEKKDTAEENKKTNVWATVVANAKIIDYPKEEVDKAIAQYKKTYEDYAESNGATLTELLEQFGMTEDQFNEEINTYGKQAVSDKLVFQSISLKENIVLTDEEYEKNLPEYVTEYGFTSTDELIKYYGEDVVKDNMLRDKVLDFVLSKAVEAKAVEAK